MFFRKSEAFLIRFFFALIGGGSSSVVVDPREIRITETSPDGDTGHALPPESMFNVDMGGAAPSGVPPSGEDFDDDRGGWGNKLDFLFSCISVSVGLGSKCSQNIRYSLPR